MNSQKNETERDPAGSIFLPKTNNPTREFENWRLQLLLGRGVAKDKSYDEIIKLNSELIEV